MEILILEGNSGCLSASYKTGNKKLVFAGEKDAAYGTRSPRVFCDEFFTKFVTEFGDEFSESPNLVINLVTKLVSNVVMNCIWCDKVDKGSIQKKNGKKAVRLTAWVAPLPPPSPEAVRKM